jgi:transposase
MLGLVTTQDGDVPLFMCPLDGNSSDKVSISAIVGQIIEQLRGSQTQSLPEEPLVVFDSGG